MPDPGRDDDARGLSRLGYVEELARAMGGYSTFAVSFSIISVLTGVFSTYGDALRGGGPAALGVGWPIVSVGTMVVALAMAELASAFPTAGALYHWSALLGGPGAGWLTAMMNLVGQIAIVAAIDLACAQALTALVGLPRGASYVAFALLLGLHALINVVSVRAVAVLNDFSATVHIVGVLAIAAALFVFGRAHPLAYLADTSFTARDDHAYPLGFFAGLVLGMWTFTGFDASAHVSEETHDPARRAPIGIVSAVAVSAVAGYALVASLTLAIRDLPAAAASSEPAMAVLRGALGDAWGRAAMLLVVLAMAFAGLSSVTSASRMLFAFARDGGLPFASALRSVAPARRTPHVAIGVSCLASFVLVMATAPFSESVFLAVASLATTALYVSYALPIAFGAIARMRGRWRRRGPWNLRGAGVPVAWMSIVWTLVVLAVCAVANALGFALLLGATIVIALVYLLAIRGRFHGPPLDLATIEAEH